MKNLVSASLLACNKEKIIEEVSSLQQNGVDIVHFDVMDGKFVNNVSFNDDTFHKKCPNIYETFQCACGKWTVDFFYEY